ncbi:MAG: metallophosphoesterase [Actinomycetota bacterium]
MISRDRTRRVPGIAAALASLALVVASTAPAGGRPADPVIVAVGDIACQSLSQGTGQGACRSDEIADLITSLQPTRFLALGDLQYNNGTPREFRRVWDVQFGHLKPITAPAPGNHEYGTADAQGYYDYFGALANGPLGYYSFDLGSWHIVSLNSDICGDQPGCGPGTPHYDWLQADLRENADAECTLAFQHHPRFDWRPYQKWIEDDGTTQYGGTETAPYVDMVRLMDSAGVDVLLVGHNHIYQRWAPQDGDGNLDSSGVRQFTVGTGGRSLYPYGPGARPANLRATQNKAFGVLQMTLHPESYDFAWVPLPGEPAFTDDGEGVACA